MAGNTSKWRKSLAGLAAVATLATMGLVAGTASAAAVTTPTYKVTVGSDVYTVTKGQSVLDADSNTYPAVTAGNTAWKVKGTNTYFDFKSVPTADVELESTPVTSTNKTTVNYYNDAGTKTATVTIEQGAKIPSAPLPLDVPGNSKAPTGKYEVTTTNNAGEQSTDPQVVDSVDAANTTGATVIDVKPQTAEGKTVHFQISKDAEATASADAFTANSTAQGNDGLNFKVDVPKDQKTVNPADYVKTTVSSKDDEKYFGVSSWRYTDVSKATGEEPNQKFTSSTELGNVKKGSSGNYAVTAQVRRAVKVSFLDAKDGKTELADAQYIVPSDDNKVAKPANPTTGGLFKQWATAQNGGSKWDFDTVVTTAAPVVDYKLNLYGQWVDGGNYTVTYKLGYDGATDPTPAKYGANEITKRPADPTREGYVFKGWFAQLGDGSISNTEFVFGSALNADVTLYAKWDKASQASYEAFLNYVPVQEKAVIPGTSTKFADAFTDASWTEYVKSYQDVQSKYAELKTVADRDGVDISDADLATLTTELKDAQAKLVFKHAINSKNRAGVYRLAKGDKHLYTSDGNEIAALTSTQNTSGNWTKEGLLFKVADTTTGAGADFTYFTNEQGGYTHDHDFVPALLVAVKRLYDPYQDEYLYTIDENEYTANQNAGADGEGTAFFIPARADEGREVYRLAYGNKHLYSTDPNEVKVAQQYGWTYEGVAFKSFK